MKTQINRLINDWTNVKNHCRTTVNKEFTDNEPSDKFKEQLIISEHTPIRLIEFDWTWNNIPYWVSTEWSRHKFEKYISTQRTDRTGVNREQKPQGAEVKFDGFANAQHLIDAFRKRLCFQASPQARNYAIDFKKTLYEYEPNVSNALVPNCIYRCGCPEFKQCECRFWDRFVEKHKDKNLYDIKERYKLYNNMVNGNNNDNSIILLIGESASGKDTVANILCEKYNLSKVKSYTTRQQRYDGEDTHTFITNEEFDKLENLVAWTVFDNNKYGATAEQLDNNDVYIVDPCGLQYLKSNYKGSKKIVSFYINSLKGVRYSRMIKRGESEEQATNRIQHDDIVFKNVSSLCDYTVDNYISAEICADTIYDIFKGGK